MTASDDTRRERLSSADARFSVRLIDRLGVEGAHRAVDAIASKFSAVELAALHGHWPLWCRSKQRPPSGEWRSWLFLTSRGWGKTLTVANHITEEVIAGRAMSIGLAAQNENKTVEVQVGNLLKVAPPWFRPEWIASAGQLVWPNGAVAFARTPEVPGAIRSENHHLAWISELQSWPVSTREEAWSNFDFATRVGYARTIVDATPKRAHPILKRLLARGEANPLDHRIVRGSVHENPHLPAKLVAQWIAEYGGTQKGREELLGEMLDESENALIKQAWITKARRHLPDAIVRRVIAIDPAVTTRAGSDRTGIIDAGLGVDGQMLVLGDLSGKHDASKWAGLVLDAYVSGDCDCVVVETNKGGDLVTQNLRAHAGRRGLSVVVLGKDERPRKTPGTVNVKEVHARGPKEDRAQPLATAYERGRVSHVVGADLAALEDTLTTWEPAPGQRSPDALDALVHAAAELLGLLENRADPTTAFAGITAVAAAIATPAARGVSLAALLGRSGASRI